MHTNHTETTTEPFIQSQVIAQPEDRAIARINLYARRFFIIYSKKKEKKLYFEFEPN